MIVLGGSWQDLWLTWANRVRVWLEPWAAVGVHGYPPSGTEVVLVQVLLLELLGLALLTVLWSFLPRPRSPHTGWSRAWRAALLGAGLVLAGLQVQEFALRAYLATLPPAPFVPDPFYLYVGNPNQTITFTYPLPIRFNSVGLRERELPFAKPPGEFRILVTGDSNAFGQGVEADQVWPRVLESLLRERYPGRRITVINQAMPGYSLAQSWYLYQEVGRRYDPDLILVGCHGWTVRPETRDSRRFLVEVAPLRRLHRALYRSQTYLAVRKEVVRWHAHRTGWVPPEFCDPVQDLRLCIPDLFRFLEEVQSRRLAAVFVAPGPPTADRPLGLWQTKELLAVVQAAGPDRPILFVEWFRDLPLDQFTLSATDQHFSVAGHASIARRFAEQIVKGRLLERTAR